MERGGLSVRPAPSKGSAPAASATPRSIPQRGSSRPPGIAAGAAGSRSMFLPLRDENTSGKFPAVNVGLLVANIAVFVYQLTLTPQVYKGLVMANAMVPARIPSWLA